MDFRAVLPRLTWTATSSTSPVVGPIAHGFAGREGQKPRSHHVQQVHGTTIAEASADTAPDSATRIQADGLYSLEPGQTVAVKTADCLPILIASPGMAMAVHAGWRGLTAGILGQAVDCCIRLGFSPSKLAVAVGPSISLARFEVGPEVVDALLGNGLGFDQASWAMCVSKGTGDRWHVDLGMAAALYLLRRGVSPERMSVMRSCTFQEADQWFSYRREGRGCGSNWSWLTVSA